MKIFPGKQVFLLFLLLLLAFCLPAQEDPLSLKVALIGPGDELYFWWGHIGLVVENNVTGEERFYDWGIFDFNQENFFVNFAMGRLFYYCGVSPAWMNYNHLSANNRDITLYTLNLSMQKKLELIQFAENNVRPENRTYNYHHFDDNCATRIRDIIDMAVDGQFKAAFGEADGRFTLRGHVSRHTWHNLFIDWILNFWMGQGIDRPIKVWDEMFLPSEIILVIKDFQYVNREGNLVPLVTGIENKNLSLNRPRVLDTPKPLLPAMLVFSLVFSSLLFLLYVFLSKHKRHTVYFGLLNSSLGLFFGIIGLMLFFLSFITDHDYTYHNSNILFVNPLFLAALPLGIILAFTKNPVKKLLAARLLGILWAITFLGCLASMFIKLFPAFYQQNQVSHALLIPISLAMLLCTLLFFRETSCKD